MGNAFDPYLHWLGIRDPERPPNHYRLLGIELLESDRDVIAMAADRQMSHVRSFQNGPHAERSQQILNELAQARVCLLDPQRKAEYDRQLQVQRQPESAQVPPPPAVPVISSVQPVQQYLAHQDAAFRLQRPRRGLRGRRGRRLLVGLLLVSLPLAWLLIAQPWHPGPADGSSAQGPPSPAEVNDPSEELPSEALLANDPELLPHEADGSEPGPEDPVVALPSAPDADPDEPTAPPVSESSAESAASDLWAAAPEPVVRPQFAAHDALGAVLVQLSHRDLRAARAQLETIRQSPSALQPADAVASMELLLANLEQFWQAFEDGLAALRPGGKLQYRQHEVTVIDVQDGLLELGRAEHDTKVFNVRQATVQADLAVALVEFRYRHALPAAWRMIGTFLSVDKHGDLNRAREYWQLAEQQGLDCSFLTAAAERIFRPPAASDAPPTPGSLSSTPVSEPVAVPVDDQLRAAQQAIRERFQKELRDRSSEARSALAQQMLAAAGSETDVARRYVLLNQGRTFALLAGDWPIAASAIDALGQGYQVDVWQLRKEALQSLARKWTEPAQRRQLLQLAEEIAQQALTADRYETASEVLQLALPLARRLREPQWLNRLSQQREAVEQLQTKFQRLEDTRQAIANQSAGPDDWLRWGRFVALMKEDFSNGLPLLAQGGDHPLAGAARDDLQDPTAAQQQKNLADQWYQLASEAQDSQQAALLSRARHWYEQARPELDGDQVVEVNRRLTEIARFYNQQAGGTEYCLDFQGQQYVTLPTLYYDGTVPLTLQAIVRGDELIASGGIRSILSNCHQAGVGLCASHGYWQFWVHDGTRYQVAKSDQRIAVGAWVHLAGVFDGRNVLLFVNGTVQSNRALVPKHQPSKYPFVLGGDPGSAHRSAEHLFLGQIREASLSRAALTSFSPASGLTPNETTWLLLRLNEGRGELALDLSGNDHHGLITRPLWQLAHAP